MNKHLKRALQAAGIIVIILIILYAGIAVVLYSSSGAFPMKDTGVPPVRIKNLVWPTIGYPAMLAPGATLSVEFDFNRPGDIGDAQPDKSIKWNAVLKPARTALKGMAYRLKASRIYREISDRWPAGTSRGPPNEVWHAEFRLPSDAVPELYDLTVKAEADGRTYTDRQPHSVAVTEVTKGDFRFVTLSDIHVHRRNISAAFQPQSNKGITLEGRPVFFERAIDQVNLIRPDFVIMLGDYVRAQHAPGDYQIEFENFYETLSRFEVPVFMIPGNHDQYINEVDGAVVWEENLGPLRYSFDVAGCHFTAANTTDWPRSDRIVMKKLGLFVYPRKWQGQLLESQNEKKVEEFRAQLGWMREDLEASQAALSRFLLLHHDPYVPNGEGIAFKNERFALLYSLGGGGKGKTAARELATTYRVAFAFTGHNHFDDVGRVDWHDGAGETVYANQTCVTYDKGGMQDHYPGYRLVEVEGGLVKSFAYVTGDNSIPFYDGSSLRGETDIDNLDRPALSATEEGDGWLVESYLGIDMELRGLVLEVPSSQGDYATTGGEVYRYVKVPGKDRALVYVSAVAPRGVPGASATRPGTPSRTEVAVSAPAAP
jgi:predicted MPP superfamily phosphohydrolase